MSRTNSGFTAERPLKLLMVNTVRAGFNGQMMFILKYLRAMNREGMRVGFVSKGEPRPEIRAQLEALGVEIYPMPLRNRHPLSYFVRLLRLIRREGFDIVHVHGNSATVAIDLLAARLGGARVRIAHSHNTSTGFPLAHRALRPLLLGLANARMACGQEAGEWLFGRRDFEIVPIASDPALYAFDEAKRRASRREMGVGDDALLVGMIGQLNSVKNPDFLLESLVTARALRPELRLAMIGQGPLMAHARETAACLSLDDVVVFTGPVQDVPERMMALDLLAMPSLYEGFPNVLVEAQLAGLPALVSDRVTRDCDMTGLLAYLPLEPEAWTRALIDARPIDRAAACERARAAVTARGFDLNAAAEGLRRRYLALAQEFSR